MPNWCRNIIKVNDSMDFNKMLEFVKSDERCFDFEKVIPLPDTLGITCGSLTALAAECYLSAINPATEEIEGIVKETPAEFMTTMKDYNSSSGRSRSTRIDLTAEEISKAQEDFKSSAQKSDLEHAKNILELGKVIINNAKKYHALTWYDFCITQWGTKWNACDDEVCADECMVVFDTAWSPPLPVIEALTKKLINIPIEISFADIDDFGGSAGRVTFMNGSIIKEIIPSSYNETLELTAEICGFDLSSEYVKIKGAYYNIFYHQDEFNVSDNFVNEAKRVLSEDAFKGFFRSLRTDEDEGIRTCNELAAYCNIIIDAGGKIEDELEEFLSENEY